jgi:hypothetical protein
MFPSAVGETFTGAPAWEPSRSPPRFEELANFLLVARITHAADFQPLPVAELKLPTRLTRGRADATVLAQQFRDLGSVLSHVATADEASQHGETQTGRRGG